MPTDTRSAVAEAFAKQKAEGGGDGSDAGAEAAAASDSGSDRAQGVDAAPEQKGDSGSSAPGGDRTRDETGRFVAKGSPDKPSQAAKGNPAPRLTEAGAQAAAAPGAPAPDGAAPAAVPASVSSSLPELKAPADWRPLAKEKWKDVPREVQEDAIRLYGETRKTLDENAALRKELDPWKAAVGPYAHLMAGAQPQQIVGNLLRTLAVLQTGHPQARAQAAAGIVRDFVGTDETAINLLAAALNGTGAPAPAPTPPPISEEQIFAKFEARQTRAATVAAAEQFKASNPEFLNDVLEDMSAILDGIHRQANGRPATVDDFKQAYDKACRLNDKVAAALAQRKEAEAAKARNASTSAAAAAASGVKSEPAGPSGAPGPAKDTREEVARQFRKAKQARV